MSTAIALLQFSAAGFFAGLTAGLFGVGGGLVLVPVLIALLPGRVPAEYLMQCVVATSLAAIVFSSASSACGHWKRNAVDTVQWRRLLTAVSVGSTCGGLAASFLPHQGLLIYVAALQSALCVYLVRKTFCVTRGVSGSLPPPPRAAIGAISALCVGAGISIGTLAVPYLRRHGVAPHVAIGTASALGVPVAMVGTAVLAISGCLQTTAIPWSVGFIYLPALVGLTPGVIAGAQVGALAAHRCAPRVLMGLFCLFLATLSLRSIAVVFS